VAVCLGRLTSEKEIERETGSEDVFLKKNMMVFAVE
jgi:hypothetical protein